MGWNPHGLPVYFGAKDISGPGSVFKYLSSEMVPTHPKAGEIIRITNHFLLDRNVSAVYGIDLNAKVYGGILHGMQLDHDVVTLCGNGRIETFTAFEINTIRDSWVDAADVTICGLQCPLTKGAVKFTYGIQLYKRTTPFLGDISFHFTATASDTGAVLFSVQQDFGTRLANATGIIQSNQTAAVVAV